jgi:hypothetical protein
VTRHPSLVVAVLLGACAAGGDRSAGGWNPECPATPTCTLHACAAEAGEDGIVCCIEAEGRGLDEEAAADLARSCDADTISCDPADYISEAAAVCIAQVAGLQAGAGSCWGSLQVHATDGQAGWLVQSESLPNCSTGHCLEVDAATGDPDTGSTRAWAD